jgi:ferredoxin
LIFAGLPLSRDSGQRLKGLGQLTSTLLPGRYSFSRREFPRPHCFLGAQFPINSPQTWFWIRCSEWSPTGKARGTSMFFGGIRRSIPSYAQGFGGLSSSHSSTAIGRGLLRRRITCDLSSLRLQDLGVTAVPIPSEPYKYWDVEKKEGRGILSLKHAGYLAGLGILGRNTLLTNNKLGNRITLGALLLNASLEGDPIAKYRICKEDCNACVTSCPARALDGKSVVQKLCREKSELTTPKGYSLYVCNTCRTVCPSGEGSKGKMRRIFK